MSKISNRITDTLVHYLPFLFQKRKKSIRRKLEKDLQKRWKIVIDTLGVSIKTPHQLEIPFEAVREASYSRETKAISLTSYFALQTEGERFRTIDHEIAHYVQYELNPYLRRKPSSSLIPNDLYWLIKRKLNKPLTEKAFTEGFATYVSSITSGNLSSSIRRVIKTLEDGKRLKILFQPELLPYALGYITYYTISKSESEKFAINVGLHDSPSKWLMRGREAFDKSGKRCII